MKCKYCGSNLSLEDKYCPYCGKLNDQVVEHQKDMAEFKQDYEKTKGEVLENVSKSKRKFAKIVILAILVALFAVACFLFVIRDDLRFDLEDKKIAAKKDEYIYEIEDLMARKDYCGLYEYFSVNHLSYSDALEEYSEVYHYSYLYQYLFENVITLITYDYATYYYTIEELITEIGEKALNIFETEEINQYSAKYYEGNKGEYIDAIKDDVVLLLKTYFKLNDGQANELRSLNKGRMIVLLEDAYEN